MEKRVFTKPDGRTLTLYGSSIISENIVPTNPVHGQVQSEPHLRWNPLREEWVAYATHRENRTFLPSAEFNPLAPTKSPDFPTELPAGEYDIAVFDNLFASFNLKASTAPELIVPTRPGSGHCEVVVFTQDPSTFLGALSVTQIDLLLQVLQDRYVEISRKNGIQYILPFENRGVEVGVTLSHPHGQIYSYPFVPPVPERMLRAQKSYWSEHGKTLLSSQIECEVSDGSRMLYESANTAAFVPVCARYPYEVWIAPRRPVARLEDLSEEERKDLARALKTVLLKYEGLWQRPFPYLMVLYAAPCDHEPHPEWHFHIEFSPPYRSRNKLKYLAGTELGAGLFVNDSYPEEKARELREIEVDIGN